MCSYYLIVVSFVSTIWFEHVTTCIAHKPISTLIAINFQKADSGDSGNEEPNAEDDFYVKQEARRNAAQRKQYVPVAPKADKIAERINTLSNPRDYQKEKVPDGLVDSMPPEGRY